MTNANRKQHQQRQPQTTDRCGRRTPTGAVSTTPRRGHDAASNAEEHQDGLESYHRRGSNRAGHNNRNNNESYLGDGSIRSRRCESTTSTSEGSIRGFAGHRVERGNDGGRLGAGGDDEYRNGVAAGVGGIGGGEYGCGDRGFSRSLETGGGTRGGYGGVGTFRCSSPRGLALRLGELEAKVASGGGGRETTGGEGRGGGGVDGRDGGKAVGNAEDYTKSVGGIVGAGPGAGGEKGLGDMSTAEDEVQVCMCTRRSALPFVVRLSSVECAWKDCL